MAFEIFNVFLSWCLFSFISVLPFIFTEVTRRSGRLKCTCSYFTALNAISCRYLCMPNRFPLLVRYERPYLWKNWLRFHFEEQLNFSNSIGDGNKPLCTSVLINVYSENWAHYRVFSKLQSPHPHLEKIRSNISRDDTNFIFSMANNDIFTSRREAVNYRLSSTEPIKW